MATKLKQNLLQADPDANGPPRIGGMSETGYTGLKVASKHILEEAHSRWRMPQRIRTVDEMMEEGYLSAAINLYVDMLSQVPWQVKPPVGASAKAKERAKMVDSCRDDMEQSWECFMRNALTNQLYGFSVIEKTYKYRLRGKSRHDDGAVGIKSLSPRAQSTLDGWEFSDDGRNLTAFIQRIQDIQYSERFYNLSGEPVRIPREKFLLFTTKSSNGNPEGIPPLKAAYYAWRMKQEVENQELLGASRDLSGLFHIQIPAAYMNPDATPAQKAVYEEYKRVLRNISKGEQQGIITPSDVDPETKQPLFKAELMQSSGAGAYDTNAIIQRYASQMLVSLFADLLQMGTSSTGSFALSDNKREIIEFALKARLNEIRDVLNFDLIPQIYKMNQWELVEMPRFEYGDINPIDLESLSKAVQRMSAVGALELTRDVLNITRTSIGADPLPVDTEPLWDYLPEKTSRSGDGMASSTGGLNGTSNSVSGTNQSDQNMDNKA